MHNRQHPLPHHAIIVAACLIVPACGAPQGTEPDDMSASDHRRAAAAQRAKVARHRALYDPTAVDKDDSLAPGTGGGSFDFPFDAYNPTAVHEHAADKAAGLARRHLAAARELETFEEGACKRFPPKTRGVCPVLTTITAWTPIDGGVRLFVRKSVSFDAVVAHARCHFAFGRARGFARMPDCPLYITGLELTADSGAKTIELKASKAAGVAELRRRAATHAPRR